MHFASAQAWSFLLDICAARHSDGSGLNDTITTDDFVYDSKHLISD